MAKSKSPGKANKRSVGKRKGIQQKNKRTVKHGRVAKKKNLNNAESGVYTDALKHHGENDHQFINSDDDNQDDEVVIEDEDVEFFSSMPQENLSFLSNLEASPSEPSKRSRKRKLQEEKERNFEEQPRSGFNEGSVKKLKPLLPIKHKKGIELQWGEKQEGKEHDQETEEEAELTDEEPAEETEEPLPPVSTVELFARRQRKLQEKKQQIASLGSAIVEDPEGSTRKLKELRMMLDEKDPDVLISVRKLVMVSLLEIFKDITPGYIIRELSDQEKSKQLSKDVQRVRDFEEGLIKNYKLYLEKLERVIKGYKRKERKVKKSRQSREELSAHAKHSLREVAARCMCNLMTSLSHFNYRSNIISLIVPLVADKDKQISDMCCDAVRQLFKEDPLGEASLDAVKVITRIVKAKNFHVKRKVLDTFLALKIKDIDLNAQENEQTKKFMTHKEKMMKLSRKERKRSKRADKLEKELLEAASTESKKRKQHLQTEIIKMVFAIYFRILKKADSSTLLPSVLEGLSKYAHLINIDFFDDLVKVLHLLIDSGELSTREILHCILTVFQLLSGQGQALNIDPLKFYSHLYRILFELHTEKHIQDLPIALQCLDVMINKRKKQVTVQRVLAFAKKLGSLSLQVPPNASLGILAAVRSFLLMHTKCEVLLDNDTTGSGVFLPELQEPEHCNAHNTALWELYLLRRHYHPSVRQYSSFLCRNAASQTSGSARPDLIRKSPLELLSEYDSADMTFNPSIQPPTQKKKNMAIVEKPYLQSQIQEEVNKAINDGVHELDSIDFCKSLPNLKLLKSSKGQLAKTSKERTFGKSVSKKSHTVLKNKRKFKR
ncbi:nucleolar complex protein 3 homolog [Ptychodera flava]|uniref:nucleolar complex protein 3 homolog n=1 Tax=Ptychodera flava TaxID=63121 RepID=UPI003969DF5C